MGRLNNLQTAWRTSEPRVELQGDLTGPDVRSYRLPRERSKDLVNVRAEGSSVNVCGSRLPGLWASAASLTDAAAQIGEHWEDTSHVRYLAT